jgi:hypothetical protein
MPLMRYFLYVGAALLVLLFVAGGAFPTLPVTPAAETTDTAADLPTIRIHTDRKWPERVVFDTSAPTIVPVQTQIAKNEAGVAAPATVADASTKVAARDAFAELVPADLKKPTPKPQQKRKVAKRRVAPPTAPTMLVAQRPQFGFFAHNIFANNIW